ncbi:MAG: hypothetical protein JRD43_08940, partial [Deltaproteobacteria bacterium]|nr:hypothetical protein [Deltaproteobacteria bacterium]
MNSSTSNPSIAGGRFTLFCFPFMNMVMYSFCLDKWEKPREFAIVKKLAGYENNQGLLFPKWHYQVICHNQEDVSAK